MKGGIVAQLAHDSLGNCMDVLIQGGPSKDVLNYGSAIKIGQDHLWNDNLDSNDEQVICGVYKIFLVFPKVNRQPMFHGGLNSLYGKHLD